MQIKQFITYLPTKPPLKDTIENIWRMHKSKEIIHGDFFRLQDLAWYIVTIIVDFSKGLTHEFGQKFSFFFFIIRLNFKMQ